MKSLLLIISCVIIASAFPLAACANDMSDIEWKALLAMYAEAKISGICYVHKIQMTQKAVPIRWGLAGISVEGTRLFPFAKEYSNGGCRPGREKTAEVYICKECQNAEALWIEQRKQK